MKKSLRRVVSIACGIISVSVLLYMAIRFPEYYCAYTDRNTLNNMVTTDLKVQIYETAYTSFAEKIHALVQAQNSGITLSAVRMNETEVNPGRKEMTRIIREEFKKMKENGIIFTAFKPKVKNMTTCERYTIYAANEHDSLKGISCWKVEYESKKRTITLYLDEEYHKIYYLRINQKRPEADAAVSSVYDEYETKYSDLPYLWWDGMVRYYDLTTYQGFFDSGFETYDIRRIIVGKIAFEALQEPLEVYCSIGSNEEAEYLIMGLLIEKMIQF